MEERKAKLEVWTVKIQNQERIIRQRALKELLEFCQNKDNLNADNAIEIFDLTYLCLIKCYSDKYEMCRSISCSIISQILKFLEQNDYYLGLLVPVIAKRLASSNVVEESEEMRLQLLQQLHFIINKYQDLYYTGSVRKHIEGEDRLLKPYNDIMDILKICLFDNYPAILKECCKIIKLVAAASPSFHYRAEALASPLETMLKHRHSSIRIAAIEALGVVALHLLSNVDRVRKIIKDISPLLMDQVPLVRKECGKVGCLFLTKLRDRYSLFEQIIPLVLCCLTDDIDDVKDEIEELWIEAGNLYYEENQTELQNLNLIDNALKYYPESIIRPTLGCRALVRRSLKVLNAVLHEMEDWKEEVRLHSTKLLMQIVIHSEDHLATKYYDINAVLCKTCQDSEFTISKLALEVAALIGYFVNQKTWSKHVFDEIKLRQNKLGPIKCLNILYRSSHDKERYDNLNELILILFDHSVCHNNSPIFQNELLQLLDAIIPGIRKSQDHVMMEKFYTIILKTTAIGYDDDSIRTYGMKIMKMMMVDKSNLDSLSILHSKYLKSALDTLELDDKSNNESAIILYGIICICGFEKLFINEIKHAIVTALENSEAEGKIKILSAISIASLNWDKTINADDPSENFLILISFVNDCIAPHLIWHAGRTAESIRTMATAALCSIAQGTTEENDRKILEAVITSLVSLIDDNSIATRSYVLKIFMYIGPLKYTELKLMACAVLSRLDDPGNEVREAAAKCLAKLELNDEDDEFKDAWESILMQIYNTMMIHLESPEIDLRNALVQSISVLGRKYPKTYKVALSESTISNDLKTKLPSFN